MNWLRWISRIMARILGISSQWVNKQSWDLRSDKGRGFEAVSLSEWWKSRIKLLSCRLLQCLGPVNTLIAEGCSGTGPAMHSSKHLFRNE